jgi:ferredoxin-NADP reductase
MSMIRTRGSIGSSTPFRLLYSVRTPGDRYYAGELDTAPGGPGRGGPDVTFVFTRATPEGWTRPPGRLTAAELGSRFPAGGRPEPMCFVCGPTGFVEAAAGLLVAQGHDPNRIRTERFGPVGG